MDHPFRTSIHEISRMLFSNVYFNSAHFLSFSFQLAQFEIETYLNLKLKKVLDWCEWNCKVVDLTCQFSFQVFNISSFAHLVYRGRFVQIWIKSTEWSSFYIWKFPCWFPLHKLWCSILLILNKKGLLAYVGKIFRI